MSVWQRCFGSALRGHAIFPSWQGKAARLLRARSNHTVAIVGHQGSWSGSSRNTTLSSVNNLFRQRFASSQLRHQQPSARSFTHSSRQQQYGRRRPFNYQTFKTSQGLFYRWAARPTFYYEVAGITVVGATVYVYNLEQVPVSDRYRFNIISASWEKSLGESMYRQTMQEFGRKLMPEYTYEHRLVKKVLDRLIPHSGLAHEDGWEVHVINDPMKNAFVIPGGKVFVFRGILDVAKGEDGLAAVLGHEIAHNVAHHAAERMSSSYAVMFPVIGLFWALGLDPGIGQMLVKFAFELPGSRAQESEADYIGLMMMAESCYDPSAAMGLWAAMEKQEHGTPPQFLSTHPSSHSRLEQIREWLPKAQDKRKDSDCGEIGGYADAFRRQVGYPTGAW